MVDLVYKCYNYLLVIDENHALLNILSDSYKGVATHSIYINHEISAAVSELYLFLVQLKKKVRNGEIPAFKFSSIKQIADIMELIRNDPQKGKGQINAEWEQLLEQINQDLDVEFTSESFISSHTK
ncbi:MAG: hypothetical protein GX864_00735 [Mollicutes bacterium]|nr:hypothetical protein [Mollicutes bacterium]